MSFRRVFITCALVAFATGTSAHVAALADSMSTVQVIGKMYTSDKSRVLACRKLTKPADGIVGKVGNMSSAIRCFSVVGQLASCFETAIQAATFLDLERTGQSSFAATTSDLENKSGSNTADFDGLSLAESAPANMSSDQLGRTVYKQCSSYAEIQ